MSRRTLLGVTVLVVVGVAVAAAVVAARKAQQERAVVEGAVDDIEAQLADLDPVARTAVMARLAQDAGDVVAGSRDAG